MSSSVESATTEFIVTKEYRRFAEFCDACRRYRYIGLCYGTPGVGKTLSARHYSQWTLLEPLLRLYRPPETVSPGVRGCRTVLYTPSVANSPSQVEREVARLRARLQALLTRESEVYGKTDPALAPDLVIVDEADRLKMAGLEQLRDLYDQEPLGLVFIGMPGIEKRVSRYPQFYSRVGFVHQFRALSSEEMRAILEQSFGRPWGLAFTPEQFTDADGVAAIMRITGGNFRLVQRLLTQIERILHINALSLVTTDVVEAARESLVIGAA